MPSIKTGSKEAARIVTSQDENGKASDGHAQSKSNDKESKTDSDPERRTSTVGVQRMGNLRNKFESGELSEKKVKKKAAPKIKYAGAESVKSKFMEEAAKSLVSTANGPRGPKEFTPPPEGVAVGVLESNPQPRAPDVVTADDNLDPVDLTVIGETTKNLRQKFKKMEKGEEEEGIEKTRKTSFMEEFKVEVTQNARARWKDIESGKAEQAEPTERPKIDIRSDCYGGIYENEPEKFENIARAGEGVPDLPSGFSARERKEQFLKSATESCVVKKDPSTMLDINAAESGIYENEPVRRDDVIRYDDEQSNEYPPNSAKWASEAKNRFMQEASKATAKTEREKPIAIVEGDLPNGTEGPREYRFASQAKQAFLERQRAAEENVKNKARPGIIDIWSEECSHSGVFESTPAAHTADVVVGASSEEDEEEEAEE